MTVVPDALLIGTMGELFLGSTGAAMTQASRNKKLLDLIVKVRYMPDDDEVQPVCDL